MKLMIMIEKITIEINSRKFSQETQGNRVIITIIDQCPDPKQEIANLCDGCNV